MLKIGDEEAVNLLRFFDDLPDPRSKVNRLHRLGDVIVIAVCAVIATADGPTAIASWAQLNEGWLKKHLKLPNGIPGKDTFRRVLGVLRAPLVVRRCKCSRVKRQEGHHSGNGNQRNPVACRLFH